MGKLFSGPRFLRSGEHYSGNAQEELSKPMFEELDNLPDEVLLRDGAEALAARLAAAHAIEAPRLLEKQTTIQDEPTMVAPHPHVEPKPGTRIRCFVPFEGRADLLLFNPTRESRSVQAEIEGNELVLCYETTSNDPEEVKERFRRDMEVIREGFQSLTGYLKAHNQNIQKEAQKRLQARINLLTQQDWPTVLGYPRRERHEPSDEA